MRTHVKDTYKDTSPYAVAALPSSPHHIRTHVEDTDKAAYKETYKDATYKDAR
jgi:hypothetical protein